MDSVPPSLRIDELADYLLHIGKRLARYGCPSYRLEEVVSVIADLEGYHAETFALPTGLFLALVHNSGGSTVHRMARVSEWSIDLARLTDIDRIFNDVLERKLTIREGIGRLDALESSSAAHPAALRWLCVATASASAAVFFRGKLLDIPICAFVALTIEVVAAIAGRNRRTKLLVDFAGGFIAAVVAWGAARARPDVTRDVIVLGGVIALMPGMTFTTGLAELASKSLVSGAARLMDAFVTLLSIVFGIALAIGLESFAGPAMTAVTAVTRSGLPLGYQVGAMLIASGSFAVLLSVPGRYWWSALVSGATGYIATSVATRYLPAHIAAFVAALAICVLANSLARLTKRPSQLFQVPGMMLLVPGSFGFLSLESFLQGEILDGAARGFQMVLIAGALVMGVLVSNVVMPARKIL